MLGLFDINEVTKNNKMDVLAATGQGDLYKKFVEGLNSQYEENHLKEHFPDANLPEMLQTTHREALKAEGKESVINLGIGNDVFKNIVPEPQSSTQVQNAPSVPKIGF